MTEKNYNPQQKDSKTMKRQQNVNPKIEQKSNIVETKKQDEKGQKAEHLTDSSPISQIKETKVEDGKQEVSHSSVKTEKKTEKKIEKKVKKTEAVVNGISLPISTKDSVAICKFIKGKSIDRALVDLELVLKFKKAIPITGDIPHRKGKGMMSGRYMTKPVEHFISMIKDLKANSNVNGLDEPIIVEAIPNRASRPYGRFGSVKRKRTHVKIKAVEKNKLTGGKK